MDSRGSVFTSLVPSRVRFRIARVERKIVSSERNRSVATSFVTFECAKVREAEFFANRYAGCSISVHCRREAMWSVLRSTRLMYSGGNQANRGRDTAAVTR